MVRIGRKLCRKAINYYLSLLKEAAGGVELLLKEK
jgi:hypothetical protein